MMIESQTETISAVPIEIFLGAIDPHQVIGVSDREDLGPSPQDVRQEIRIGEEGRAESHRSVFESARHEGR